ncbi:MAG: PAS domain-containing protein [Burkholderia sp.]|nr:PAS domain-containing protein [Burkholderia sp.]
MKILLLEDDPNDADLIEALLAEHFRCHVIRIQSRAEFLTALQDVGNSDLILSDYKLPSFDGLSALHLAMSVHPGLPFIFVSGTLGEEAAIEALKVGATDYVLKSRLSRLIPAVQRALREASDRAARRAAEDALRRSEAELRGIIDTIPSIAFTAEPDGRGIWINHRWVKYSGLTVEETAGAGWQSAIHSDDLSEHIVKWQQSMRSGEPFENEARHRSAEGDYRWFLVRAVPLHDEQGRILKWYGILTDIDDFRRAELERERLRHELAQMNRVNMMGELAAALTHEVQQPIAAGIINAKACRQWLLAHTPDINEARAAAEAVMTSLSFATDIIGRVRALYGHGRSERELVNVNALVREMTGVLDPAARRCLVLLRNELDSTVPDALADRVQLQQVLMNLMLNGIEAMQGTGGELKVESGMTHDGQLLISVSDTGCGLPAGEPEHIFKPFFSTKAQGTGMGLAISRRIVESHGGHLWASANGDQGAILRFTLPSNKGGG